VIDPKGLSLAGAVELWLGFQAVLTEDGSSLKC
jgi:hypothetical protein